MSAADAITLDAAHFRALEENKGGEVLRFWECESPAVVVGALATVGRQVDEDACLADGVPIVRRISGGGAVVLSRGCLNYSLILSLEARPELRPVAVSYSLILGPLLEALQLPGLSISGTGDLAIGDRKVSGNAQRRGRRALLHHGTLLYGFDVRLMTRYLKEPDRRPAYRGSRCHAEFVTNAPCAPGTIKLRMADAWSVMIECQNLSVGRYA